MRRQATFDYDLVVLGTGPAGQRAAIQGAKAGKRVAVIERKAVVGGVCINTGTIPSKTLREAVLYLRGVRERSFYGADYTVKDQIEMGDLLLRTDAVIKHEIEVVRSQMRRNGIELIQGHARFAGPHVLRVEIPGAVREVHAAKFVIATGTRAAAPATAGAGTVFTCDEVLKLKEVPRTLAVIGGGVIGIEYASMFAALGVRVTLVEQRDEVLPFIDAEMVQALLYHLREMDVAIRLGESVERWEQDQAGRVHTLLQSGKRIVTERVLYCVGREGATADLDLAAIGLRNDSRGRIEVNEHYQTAVSHVYAAGDVIGFPSLASTSMEQGRLAACHALGIEATSQPEFFPYGIYAIPEISMVGKTEQELTRAAVPYEAGKAHYREIARGQILGYHNGTLKMLFHQATRQLLGVHIIGEGASELIHIGQTALAFGATVDYFVNTVFNYPTLAEAYKVAAFDAANRMAALGDTGPGLRVAAA